MASGGFKVWAASEYLSHNPHIAAAAVCSGIAILGSLVYRMAQPKVDLTKAEDDVFVPPSNLGIRNIFDLLGTFVQNLAKDIIGSHYKTFLPFLIFLFTWIWLSNLLGSIPGFGSSTDNINMTLAMASFVFLYYNVQGIRSHGFKYIEQYTGHLTGILLILMGPAMFVIELISHCVRPITLGIRLRSNIYADHSVLAVINRMFGDIHASLSEQWGAIGSVFGGLIASLAPLPIVMLGLLVATIQAFVFTLLTMVYIGMATAHEEH